MKTVQVNHVSVDIFFPNDEEDCPRFDGFNSDDIFCQDGSAKCQHCQHIQTASYAFCNHPKHSYLERLKKTEAEKQEQIQSITYRAFELAESAIKAAIAQAIEEQLGS